MSFCSTEYHCTNCFCITISAAWLVESCWIEAALGTWSEVAGDDWCISCPCPRCFMQSSQKWTFSSEIAAEGADLGAPGTRLELNCAGAAGNQSMWVWQDATQFHAKIGTFWLWGYEADCLTIDKYHGMAWLPTVLCIQACKIMFPRRALLKATCTLIFSCGNFPVPEIM